MISITRPSNRLEISFYTILEIDSMLSNIHENCECIPAPPPPPPTQCYLGYAYECSNRPPLFSKSPVCKVNPARPFSFVYEPFSAKVRCVKSIRVDLFLLLRKGHFGNTHGVHPFSEWGGGTGECIHVCQYEPTVYKRVFTHEQIFKSIVFFYIIHCITVYFQSSHELQYISKSILYAEIS